MNERIGMKLFKIILSVGFVGCLVNLYADNNQSNNIAKTISDNAELEFNACLVEYFHLYPMDFELKETFQPGNNFPDAVIRTPEFVKACDEHLAKAYEYCNKKLHVERQPEVQKKDIIESVTQVVVQKIQLFTYDECPYCDKVTNFLQNNNLLDQVEFIDAGVSTNRDLLKKISGRTQAPYIIDATANVKMAESDDIIAYLAEKFKVEISRSTNEQVVVFSLSNMQDSQKIHNQSTFLSDVKQSSKPVIILISTTWCPPCKVFKPIFLEVAAQIKDVCEFILVDGDLNREIVEQLGVRGYPEVVCFKQGKSVKAQNYRSKDGLIKLVNSLIKD